MSLNTAFNLTGAMSPGKDRVWVLQNGTFVDDAHNYLYCKA